MVEIQLRLHVEGNCSAALTPQCTIEFLPAEFYEIPVTKNGGRVVARLFAPLIVVALRVLPLPYFCRVTDDHG